MSPDPRSSDPHSSDPHSSDPHSSDPHSSDPHSSDPHSYDPHSRGTIALLEENCTVCMLCARECPDWCLYIEGHTEPAPPVRPGGRERTANVLDRFAIDFSLCMYCGICIEVCPFDALFWAPALVPAETDRDGLVEEQPDLRRWLTAVPPPPQLEPSPSR